MENRDLEYEENNKCYDCQDVEEYVGIKCKNYELCKSIIPPLYADFGNYLCMTCGDWFKFGEFGWDELEFRVSEDECSVCNEKCIIQMKFPTNCGHWFCVNCSRDILFWDEGRYDLSLVPYGCPPCPNGCDNPIYGRQCNCDEYNDNVDESDDEEISIVEIWRRNNKSQWNKYKDDRILYSDYCEESGCVWGSKKCPLCRKIYTRNNEFI